MVDEADALLPCNHAGELLVFPTFAVLYVRLRRGIPARQAVCFLMVLSCCYVAIPVSSNEWQSTSTGHILNFGGSIFFESAAKFLRGDDGITTSGHVT